MQGPKDCLNSKDFLLSSFNFLLVSYSRALNLMNGNADDSASHYVLYPRVIRYAKNEKDTCTIMPNIMCDMIDKQATGHGKLS